MHEIIHEKLKKASVDKIKQLLEENIWEYFCDWVRRILLKYDTKIMIQKGGKWINSVKTSTKR